MIRTHHLIEKDHATCGAETSSIAKGPDGSKSESSHKIVFENLSYLTCMDYRSGYNEITRENDGAGILCYSLPTNYLKRSLAQMVFIPDEDVNADFDVEMASMKTLAAIGNIALRDNIPMNAASLSSQSITYKGMIRPSQIGEFYACDLQGPDFTATTVQVHARMATNTDPQRANA